MPFIPIADVKAEALKSRTAELSCASLGGHVLSFSDEWFAEATNLIKPGPAESLEGQFGPNGALYDGWETRRHNPTYDWVILRLGPNGGSYIAGFDVDTSTFNGNEAPTVEIYGANTEDASLASDDQRWELLLPQTPCGPAAHHWFEQDDGQVTSKSYTHIKLHMIPDGGISRFRVFGTVNTPSVGHAVSEVTADDKPELNTLDLAHVLNGGRVVFTNDQHFGVGSNLILPGRGKDMGDGWETKRSRVPNHRDWVVIELAEPGVLDRIEVDTLHFLGNFPESFQLCGCDYSGKDLVPPAHDELESKQWHPIVSRSKLGPGRIHAFDVLDDAKKRVTTHVRLTIFPDGGIKRLRVIGRRVRALQKAGIDISSASALAALPACALPSTTSTQPVIREADELSPQSFAAYGQVLFVPDAETIPPGGVKTVNQGTAKKYCELAHVVNAYPSSENINTNIHVYVSTPRAPRTSLLPFPVSVLERHQYTTQLFFPISSPNGARASGQEGYLVIVALPGNDGQPDLQTLKAFWAESDQGISYHPGVWHHPLVATGTTPTSFVCVVNECASQPKLDLDEVFYH